jgi:hypothetical protein
VTPGRPPASPARRWLRALIPWAVTLACFAYLYARLDAAAGREGLSLGQYFGRAFGQVDWFAWLALMLPYSVLFFLIDSLVIWRVVNWWNARVSYLDILPVRASTYVLSILNEQIGKGAMAVYLHRREGVPGWQLGSSMLFVMTCELLYLSSWATLGVLLAWERLPAIFHAVPAVTALIAVALGLLMLVFRGSFPRGFALRERPIFHAFRNARPWQYATIVLLRSPAMLVAVFVYSRALHLFGVEVGVVDMLGYLPVIFFGAATPGPMRSVAITLWVTLFPEHPAEMAAFGFVQHNFFIFFNAAIGLLFLRRANREILGEARAPEQAG